VAQVYPYGSSIVTVSTSLKLLVPGPNLAEEEEAITARSREFEVALRNPYKTLKSHFEQR